MENSSSSNPLPMVRKAKTRRGLASLNLNTNLENVPPENVFADEIKDILNAKKQCEINVQYEIDRMLENKMELIDPNPGDNGTPGQEQPHISDCLGNIDDVELLLGPAPKNPLSPEIHYLLEDLEKTKALYSNDKMEVDLEIEICEESSNEDFHFERESIPVRIFCCDKYYRFTLSMNAPLLSIMEEIGQQLNVPPSRILLSLNDRVVRATDTPSSINLDITDIIEGYIMDINAPSAFNRHDVIVEPVTEMLNLKIQTKDLKSKVLVQIKKTDRMLILMEKFAQITNFEIENLKFTFDGEEILPNDTAENLGLDNDFCIDVGIKSK